jgi:hypothetical protein
MLLVIFCLFVIAWDRLTTSRSDANTRAQEPGRNQTASFEAVWIGSVALLGWILLVRLRRMDITGMGATVDQVLFRLSKNAGVTALQAIEIRRINKPRGLVLGTAGVLLLLAGGIARIETGLTGLGFLLLIFAR